MIPLEDIMATVIIIVVLASLTFVVLKFFR
jgi:hypothetical protein